MMGERQRNVTAFEEGYERQKHKICSKSKVSAEAIFLIVLSDDRGRSHQDNSSPRRFTRLRGWLWVHHILEHMFLAAAGLEARMLFVASNSSRRILSKLALLATQKT